VNDRGSRWPASGSAAAWGGLRAHLPCRCRALIQTALQFVDEVRQVGIEQLAQVAQFQRIDPAHATLDVAHKRLGTAQLFGDRRLGQAAFRPQLADERAKSVVLGTVNGLGHDRVVGEAVKDAICEDAISEKTILTESEGAAGRQQDD